MPRDVTFSVYAGTGTAYLNDIPVTVTNQTIELRADQLTLACEGRYGASESNTCAYRIVRIEKPDQ
jgi:hypothetical protein